MRVFDLSFCCSARTAYHRLCSVKAHEYVRGDVFTRGHMPLNGFTDGKVISDARFRLATALREVRGLM